jgi:hypothetical protein
VFLFQLVILGLLDGIWLSFKVPIACDLVESSALGNQAQGYYHAAMMPMSIGKYIPDFIHNIVENVCTREAFESK